MSAKSDYEMTLHLNIWELRAKDRAMFGGIVIPSAIDSSRANAHLCTNPCCCGNVLSEQTQYDHRFGDHNYDHFDEGDMRYAE